jgi:hypothetical protein
VGAYREHGLPAKTAGRTRTLAGSHESPDYIREKIEL